MRLGDITMSDKPSDEKSDIKGFEGRVWNVSEEWEWLHKNRLRALGVDTGPKESVITASLIGVKDTPEGTKYEVLETKQLTAGDLKDAEDVETYFERLEREMIEWRKKHEREHY